MLQSASRHPMILMAVKNIRMLEKTTTLGMDTRDVRAVWRKKRTSLLVAAARYKSFTSMVSTVFYHLTFVAAAIKLFKLVSAVYCLCTGNDISIYALISKAAVLEVDLKPDSIICDFETVPIHAIQAVS
ncbi:hypothetical protein T4D_11972 [Trichinella pseudospiralis]|uniref:Uncharacterized protein n=1 Tax=Trichinella pseudospiralis TaxID=6337 RepID=A0A0V1FDH1_TRIPS|nr:hypothetical protein T4D_11972 [Trichinella pseudospiralis]